MVSEAETPSQSTKVRLSKVTVKEIEHIVNVELNLPHVAPKASYPPDSPEVRKFRQEMIKWVKHSLGPGVVAKLTSIAEFAVDTALKSCPKDVPGSTLTSIIAKLIAVSAFVEDSFDFPTKTNMCTLKYSEFYSKMEQAIESLGGEGDLEDIQDELQGSMGDIVFSKVMYALLSLKKETMKSFPDMMTPGSAYQAAMIASIRAQQWKDMELPFAEQYGETLFRHLHANEQPTALYVEVINGIYGVKVDANVKNHVLFQSLLYQFGVCITLATDIFGLQRQGQLQKPNLVLFKMDKEGGSLPDAVAYTAEELKAAIEDYENLKINLRLKFPSNQDTLDIFMENMDNYLFGMMVHLATCTWLQNNGEVAVVLKGEE